MSVRLGENRGGRIRRWRAGIRLYTRRRITRLKLAWWSWRRWRAAGQNRHTPLREFVYLDEVSVYSLIASRLGPIAAEFSETQTESLQDQSGVSGRLGPETRRRARTPVGFPPTASSLRWLDGR